MARPERWGARRSRGVARVEQFDLADRGAVTVVPPVQGRDRPGRASAGAGYDSPAVFAMVVARDRLP